MTAAAWHFESHLAARRVRDAISASRSPIVTGVVSRRPVRRYGDEERRPLPGDGLLWEVKGRWTHAVTIHAPPSEVWPARTDGSSPPLIRPRIERG